MERTAEVAPNFTRAVRRFSFTKEGAPPPRKLYDTEKWRALLKYDREIVLIAEKLLPLGGATRFVAEVAAAPFENHLAREAGWRGRQPRS